jgi:WD40 repeat protein
MEKESLDSKKSINSIETRMRSSTKEKDHMTPRVRNSLSSDNKKPFTSGSKTKVCDRFIPSSIGKNLISEFQSNPQIAEPQLKPVSNNLLKSLTAIKAESNYQNMLKSEILEENTPKFKENNEKNQLDLFKINRQLKFHSDFKRVRKMKINKENMDFRDSIKSDDKIAIEKEHKQFQFEDISDNFYLNNLDMWDINKILVGTKSNLFLIDSATNENDTYNTRYSYKSASEIFAVKFINYTKFVFTDSQGGLKVKELNKELLALNCRGDPEGSPMNRKYISIEQDKCNENILYLGSDNASVDFYDLREDSNVCMTLYQHEFNNEVCKIRHSSKNNLLISGGNDNRALLFDLRKNKILENFKHKAAVKGLALNEEETILFTGGGTFDKHLRLFNIKKLNLMSETPTDSQITNIEYLNNTLAVSNGYISNNVVLFRPTDEEIPILNKIAVFEKHKKRILYMTKSKSGDFLASLSTDGALKMWKINKFFKKSKFDDDSIFCGIR